MSKKKSPAIESPNNRATKRRAARMNGSGNTTANALPDKRGRASKFLLIGAPLVFVSGIAAFLIVTQANSAENQTVQPAPSSTITQPSSSNPALPFASLASTGILYKIGDILEGDENIFSPEEKYLRYLLDEAKRYPSVAQDLTLLKEKNVSIRTSDSVATDIMRAQGIPAAALPPEMDQAVAGLFNFFDNTIFVLSGHKLHSSFPKDEDLIRFVAEELIHAADFWSSAPDNRRPETTLSRSSFRSASSMMREALPRLLLTIDMIENPALLTELNHLEFAPRVDLYHQKRTAGLDHKGALLSVFEYICREGLSDDKVAMQNYYLMPYAAEVPTTTITSPLDLVAAAVSHLASLNLKEAHLGHHSDHQSVTLPMTEMGVGPVSSEDWGHFFEDFETFQKNKSTTDGVGDFIRTYDQQKLGEVIEQVDAMIRHRLSLPQSQKFFSTSEYDPNRFTDRLMEPYTSRTSHLRPEFQTMVSRIGAYANRENKELNQLDALSRLGVSLTEDQVTFTLGSQDLFPSISPLQRERS